MAAAKAAIRAGLGAGEVAVQVQVVRAGDVAGGIGAFACSGVGEVEAAVEDQRVGEARSSAGEMSVV